MKARYLILAASLLATIVTGWHTAAHAQERDDFSYWVTVGVCTLDVVPSGAALEVTVDDGPTVTIEAPQTIHVDGPATVVVGHRTPKQYEERTYEVPECPTTTVPPDTTTTTTPTSTTTTVPVVNTTSTVPTTTVGPPTTTSLPPSTTQPPTTVSVPPTTNTPTVEIYCTGVTLDLDAGTYTVRIDGETHEQFTLDDHKVVAFDAPLPPYDLVVTTGTGVVLVDADVTPGQVNDWPCNTSDTPTGDDSSTNELPRTGPSDLTIIGIIGAIITAVGFGMTRIGKGDA